MTGITEVPAVAAPRPVTPTTILAAELDMLCQQLDEFGYFPVDFADRLRHARDVAVGLDPYVADCATPESEGLAHLARRTAETDWAHRAAPDGSVFLEQEMLSGHVEGQLLKFLIHLSGAMRVLEIGMFTGYSALAMAEALPEGGTVLACEIDDSVAQFARQCFDDSPFGNRITVAVGPALDTLRDLAATHGGTHFDFVFIDADKAGYLGYLDFLLDSPLLSSDAVIAVDNTLMQGQPYSGAGCTANGEAIAEFKRSVAKDPRVEQVLIPMRDGVTLIRRVHR